MVQTADQDARPGRIAGGTGRAAAAEFSARIGRHCQGIGLIMLEQRDLPTATQIVAGIAAGRLSATEVLEACLARIAAREPVVKAFARVDEIGARAAAKAADAYKSGMPETKNTSNGESVVGIAPYPAGYEQKLAKSGPLHGVPVAFKDIINTAGLGTEHNSPIYAGNVPDTDASVVALTRIAGGIVLGKAVTCEFANRTPGPTTNPHDPTRTPGGSSSGSAASVGAGMVPLAIGTQTSGSVIRPASYCGVHGFKGSWGEISYVGVKLTSASVDTIGFYARSIADLALFHNVLTDTPVTSLEPGNVAAPRIGLCRTPYHDQALPESWAALDAVVAAVERRGARVTELTLPPHFAGLNETVRWIAAWEGARSMAWEKSFHRDRISPAMRDGRIRDGEACSPEQYRAACRLAERCRVEFDDVLGDLDVVLTPAAPGEAPVGLQATGSAVFNTAWTALHVPCITLPGHVGPNGMPVGVQLVGRRGSDRRLMEIAAWVERAALQ